MSEAIHTLSATLDELTDLVGSFNQENFNKVPFEGSWTAARVAQHLFLSLNGLPQALTGPSARTERAPDEKQAKLKEIFLNMDIKFNSPDFIFPEDKAYDKEDMLTQLSDVRSKIIAAAKDADLNLTVTSFEFPGLGYLTRLENVWFAVYHTKRHNNQLKNIRDKVTS